MRPSKLEGFLVAILLLCNFVLHLASKEIKDFKKQAIDRGHAEWRIIPGTNKTEFKWKDDQ